MYLVNRSRLHAADAKTPPRRLEPHELAELRRANKARALPHPSPQPQPQPSPQPQPPTPTSILPQSPNRTRIRCAATR